MKITTEQKLDRFKHICKDHKIKLTPQRIIIYEALISCNEHPSTDMLYQRIREKFPTISFDTVHRTMLTFCEIGVADIVEGTGNPKRFDGILDKHHHFQCMRCKKIVDIYDEGYDSLPVPEQLRSEYCVMKHTVRFEGLCKECCDHQKT